MSSTRQSRSHHRVLDIRFALFLTLLLGLIACDSTTDEAALTRDDYVTVYVEILRAAGNAPDSVAASDSARRILAKYGLTDEDLMEFAQRHADDPGVLADAWRQIEEQLRQPPDTTAEPQ